MIREWHFVESTTEIMQWHVLKMQYISMLPAGAFFTCIRLCKYSVILAALDPRKCEYLKVYSLDFELAYMTTYLAS